MPVTSAEDSLVLSGRDWGPIPRIARTIPFGYAVSPDDPDTLIPVLLELEALEKAREYRNKGFSLRKVADWIEQATGKKVSHVGLNKRLNVDRSRRSKVKLLRAWAAEYKKALIRAKDWDEKNGQDQDLWENLFNSDFEPESFGTLSVKYKERSRRARKGD